MRRRLLRERVGGVDEGTDGAGVRGVGVAGDDQRVDGRAAAELGDHGVVEGGLGGGGEGGLVEGEGAVGREVDAEVALGGGSRSSDCDSGGCADPGAGSPRGAERSCRRVAAVFATPIF